MHRCKRMENLKYKENMGLPTNIHFTIFQLLSTVYVCRNTTVNTPDYHHC